MHTVGTNGFQLKALLCIYSCFRDHLPCKPKNMLIKSSKTVLNIILHAGSHDPVLLGYKWLYQSRFCNWSPSTITNSDSTAQLRKLCQSSKQPGGSFHGSVSASVYCMNSSCNFIKWAVFITSTYKHLAAFQSLKKPGLPATSPEWERLRILPVN